jgi:ferredoxin
MAMKIVDECINCAACESECPNQAISPGDPIYVIDASRCTECVGAYETPRCKEVCPVDDCLFVDSALAETREQLQQKYARLHAF